MEPRRKAILCLCHDSSVLQVRSMLLEHFGYAVLSTSSVEGAKNMAEYECPDMLLIDNGEPGMDYERLAAQVKQSCPGVITVVLSPYFSVSRASSTASIDRFVAKDDGPDALITEIQELFAEGGDSQLCPM